MKVANDIFFYPWESYSQNNSNSIMITGQVKVLVDPGHSHLFSNLSQQIKQDGVDPSEIELVLYTHCHPDHMEAGQELAQYGARQALHPVEEEYLRNIGPDFFRAMGLSMPEIKIDIHLSEGELDLGGHKFMVFHTPGHSPGEVCLYHPESKILIAGDLIFAQGVGPHRLSRRQRRPIEGKHHADGGTGHRSGPARSRPGHHGTGRGFEEFSAYSADVFPDAIILRP